MHRRCGSRGRPGAPSTPVRARYPTGTPPVRLEVEAVATFDADQVKITTVHLDVRGNVPGMTEEEFDSAAHEADQGCPVSNALRNNVEIRVNARLEG